MFKRRCVCPCANVLILDEGVLVDRLNDIFEKDLGGKCVAVVDNRLTILAVPTVHCRGREIPNVD